MSHVIIPEAEEFLDKEIKCLDKGFVRLVDYMGSDESIVQAARVSYGKGTKKVSEDRGLIRYLMRHQHTTPFEMVEFKFHVKLPIFVARQWIRHRTANVNEVSARYSIMPDEFYVPSKEFIRKQSQTNRQGRSEEEIPSEMQEKILKTLIEEQTRLYKSYEEMINRNVARELARINLPVSLYTEWYWKIDLHNLFHFLWLRMDEHAQIEIRIYANAMAEIVKKVVPMAWEAFEDYSLHAIKFSKPELKVISKFIRNADFTDDLLKECGLGQREMNEFRDKLKKMFEL
jgi:thymidylate synthase (FAD)